MIQGLKFFTFTQARPDLEIVGATALRLAPNGLQSYLNEGGSNAVDPWEVELLDDHGGVLAIVSAAQSFTWRQPPGSSAKVARIHARQPQLATGAKIGLYIGWATAGEPLPSFEVPTGVSQLKLLGMVGVNDVMGDNGVAQPSELVLNARTATKIALANGQAGDVSAELTVQNKGPNPIRVTWIGPGNPGAVVPDATNSYDVQSGQTWTQIVTNDIYLIATGANQISGAATVYTLRT